MGARGSAEELAVRAKSDEVEGIRVGLSVDEEEIGPEVALAAVIPVPGERVVPVRRREEGVRGERRHHGPEERLELAAIATAPLALEVAPEQRGELNPSQGRAHSGPP